MGHRHGDNLFSDSIVAVDLETGERLWHYQVIHHDVWDWDFPCAPVLVDVAIEGRPGITKVVAQPSKQGWLYVLDRETGEPISADRRASGGGLRRAGRAAGVDPAVPDPAAGLRSAGW